jgi:hypothetical protein
MSLFPFLVLFLALAAVLLKFFEWNDLRVKEGIK